MMDVTPLMSRVEVAVGGGAVEGGAVEVESVDGSLAGGVEVDVGADFPPFVAFLSSPDRILSPKITV